MHQFYRFIGCNIASVLSIMENQADMAGCTLRLVQDTDRFDQDSENRITIVLRNDSIIDIFRG